MMNMTFEILAYLDPGTGSFFIQILIASFLGGLVWIKLAWGSIKVGVTHIFSKSTIDDKEVKDDKDDMSS
jgi:hypothetical protein